MAVYAGYMSLQTKKDSTTFVQDEIKINRSDRGKKGKI